MSTGKVKDSLKKIQKDHLEVGDVFTSQNLVHGMYFKGSKKKKPNPFDSARGTAHFVVEQAYKAGGGADGRGGNVPDEWFIVARRLDRGNVYNSRGEVANFFHENRDLKIAMEDIAIVGRMSMRFVNFRRIK